MPLTSTITPYDAGWPDRYNDEAQKLVPIFGAVLQATHHIGSTAVPSLAAKPEIDILVVVDDVRGADAWTEGLARHGYSRGRDLSAGHLFYRRNVRGIRTHKIHVCVEGHPVGDAMIRFRDLLRTHSEVRERYEALKLQLEAENTEGIGEYLEGKAPFIEQALSTYG